MLTIPRFYINIKKIMDVKFLDYTQKRLETLFGDFFSKTSLSTFLISTKNLMGVVSIIF